VLVLAASTPFVRATGVGSLAKGKAPIKVIARDVRRQDLLGGLIHEHYGRAA
jgi:hypothetical protein